MDTFIKMDIFFFITSVAVVLVTIFVIVGFCYLIALLRRINILSRKLEGSIGGVGDDVKEMTEQVKESFIFNFLFPKKRKNKKG